MADETISVKTTACTQCGGCLLVCPVMAIKGTLPERCTDNNNLYQDSGSTPSLKELLLYYRSGYNTIILNENDSSWNMIIEEANAVLRLMNKPLFLVNHINKDKNDSYFNNDEIATKRRRLLGFRLIKRFLKNNNLPENILITEVFKEYQWFSVDIESTRCSLCSSCLQLCPTGVFHYQNKHFVIDAGKCIGCLLCQTSCPEEALSIRPDIKKQAVSAYPFHQAFCPNCQNYYPSLSAGEHLCPACHVRQKLCFHSERIGTHSLNFRT